MTQRTYLAKDVTRCFGKLVGEPPGTPLAPCDTCARYHFLKQTDQYQRWLISPPRTDDGQCVRHLDMQLPQQELFA
jgi:hypothetical protein